MKIPDAAYAAHYDAMQRGSSISTGLQAAAPIIVRQVLDDLGEQITCRIDKEYERVFPSNSRSTEDGDRADGLLLGKRIAMDIVKKAREEL